MPIPKPKKDEKQKEFHSRCMSVIFDEYGLEQGNAVCYDAWRDSKKENKMKNLKEADTFKCPECDNKVLANTGYCVSCKKKVKPSSKKEEGFENVEREGIVWPVVSIGFIDESNWEAEIENARIRLQKYNFQFDDFHDVVSTGEYGQEIELSRGITKEDAQKLINDAEWTGNETVFLSDIMTEIIFANRNGDFITIDTLEESKNMKENNDTFKCPTCDSKVLVNTGYCLKCKKKVKPSKKEAFENVERERLVWPIITVGFIAEFDNDYEDVISEAKMYLQEHYGLQFNDFKDVVSTDEYSQMIDLSTPITWDQAQKLINDAEWMDSETVYLSDIQTEIIFKDRAYNTISLDILEESKKEIKTNTILEKSHGITVILNEEEKLKVGDRVIMSNSGLMMYSNKYKDKEYIIKDIVADHGFNTFDIGLPFRVEVLDVVKVEESKEETFILRDNVRIGRIILEKDERIKIIKKLKGI